MRASSFLACIVTLSSLFTASADSKPVPASKVYVIPIHDMIERGLVYFVRRGVNEAIKDGASTIILDIDTNGGRLDACEQIVETLWSVPPGTATATFVNRKAISAGAIIALATDRIYMAPGGRIGDAMPVLMGPGGLANVDDDVQEKMVSATEAFIRAVAKRKGHDEALAAAMVRRELEYVVGTNVISRAGELLTLTTDDAMLPDEHGNPILAAGVSESLNTLIAKLGYAPDSVVHVEVTMAEMFARFIESFPVSGFIMGMGLLLLYIESRTPGFGVAGLAGVGMLLLWFWGHHIAGLAGMGELVLFALGLALLGVEIFVLPGFGIAGISGLVMIVVSLILAMIQHSPGMPVYSVPDMDVTRAVLNLSTAVVFAALSALLLGKVLPNTPIYGALILGMEQKREKGYTVGIEEKSLLGKRGVALSDLKPSGIAEIEGERIGVQTEGPFIAKGTSVLVQEAKANRIVVVEASASGQAASHT